MDEDVSEEKVETIETEDYGSWKRILWDIGNP